MPTYTNDDSKQVKQALNILFKEYLGTTTTSLNSFVSPFGETYSTLPSVKGGDRLWVTAPPLSPISVDSSNQQVTDKIHYWMASKTYAVGDIVITPEADCTDEIPNLCYICTATVNSSTNDTDIDTGKPASATNSWEVIESISFVKDLEYTAGASGGTEAQGGKYFYNTDTSNVTDHAGTTRKVASDMIPFTYGSASDSPYDYELKDGGVDLIQGSPVFYVDTHGGTIWMPKGTDEMNYPSGTLTLSFFVYRGDRLNDYAMPTAIPVPITQGGTGQNTQAEAFNAISPASTLGDLLISNQSTNDSWKALGGNTTTTAKFLSQTGTGTASADPTWEAISAGDVPGIEATTEKLVIKNTHDDAADSNVELDIDSFNPNGSGDATLNLGNNMLSGDTVQIGNGNVDVYIDGNTVTITGTSTSYLTETVEIADNILLLNSNITTEAAEDAGFEVNRGASGNTNQGIGRPAILWDESEMDWTVNIVNEDDDETGQTDVFTTNLGITLTDANPSNTPTSGALAVEVNAMPIGGLFVNTNDDKVWIKTS